jgi:hypothetical protein
MGKSKLTISVNDLKSLIKEGYLKKPNKKRKKHRYTKRQVAEAMDKKQAAQAMDKKQAGQRSGSAHMIGGVSFPNTNSIQTDNQHLQNEALRRKLQDDEKARLAIKDTPQQNEQPQQQNGETKYILNYFDRFQDDIYNRLGVNNKDEV